MQRSHHSEFCCHSFFRSRSQALMGGPVTAIEVVGENASAKVRHILTQIGLVLFMFCCNFVYVVETKGSRPSSRTGNGDPFSETQQKVFAASAQRDPQLVTFTRWQHLNLSQYRKLIFFSATQICLPQLLSASAVCVWSNPMLCWQVVILVNPFSVCHLRASRICYFPTNGLRIWCYSNSNVFTWQDCRGRISWSLSNSSSRVQRMLRVFPELLHATLQALVEQLQSGPLIAMEVFAFSLHLSIMLLDSQAWASSWRSSGVLWSTWPCHWFEFVRCMLHYVVNFSESNSSGNNSSGAWRKQSFKRRALYRLTRRWCSRGVIMNGVSEVSVVRLVRVLFFDSTSCSMKKQNNQSEHFWR